MLAIADTHALIWYLLNDPNLSPPAQAMFQQAITDNDTIGVSAISIVEIIYLTEKGRIPKDAFELLKQELATPESVLELVPLSQDIAMQVQAIDRATVPDMPDRMIGATALQLSLPLLSRDRKIQSSQVNTIW
jgi:PIN domain nuclease of toxin-antitoxin system